MPSCSSSRASSSSSSVSSQTNSPASTTSGMTIRAPRVIPGRRRRSATPSSGWASFECDGQGVDCARPHQCHVGIGHRTRQGTDLTISWRARPSCSGRRLGGGGRGAGAPAASGGAAVNPGGWSRRSGPARSGCRCPRARTR
jgi:hypothetical protein